MAKPAPSRKPAPGAFERVVIAAAATGDIADFSGQDTPPVIRAEVLRRLLAGLAQQGSNNADPVTPRGVRISGAAIEGELDLSGWTGRADDPSRPLPALECITCTLTQPLYLDESRIGSLSLLGCKAVLISAGSARIDGSVRLGGSSVSGADDKYSGQKLALDFAGAQIGGNVILRPHDGVRFHGCSECTFLGARIEGAFNANGALLENPGGIALNCTRVNIRNSVFLTIEAGFRFETRGEARFWIAQIGGQFALGGAHLQNPGGAALGFQGGTIRGNVFLRPSLSGIPFTASGDIHFTGVRIEANLISRDTAIDGLVDMRNAHVNALFDDPQTGWPTRPGSLQLSGLTYERLHSDGDVQRENAVSARLEWITRQYHDPERPSADEFDPQPYSQFAHYLRSRGQNDDADRVLIAMRRLRLRSHIDRGPLRLFQKFLGLTCGYGYSGARAIAALLIWVLIGSGMYGAHALAGNFGPAESVMRGQHDSIAGVTVSIPGLMKTKVRGCPGLIAPLYAMDTILPLVEFGPRRACAFDPPGRFGAPLWRTLDFLYALIGAIVFAIAVVTLTGLVRED